MNRNCEICGANYAPYMKGGKEDIVAYCCVLSNPKYETKGVCQFHNPKSVFYLEPKEVKSVV